MRYSQTKQFWTWFQRNSELFLHLNDMDKSEREFWIREMMTHLRAHTKKLFIELMMPVGGPFRLVITA